MERKGRITLLALMASIVPIARLCVVFPRWGKRVRGASRRAFENPPIQLRFPALFELIFRDLAPPRGGAEPSADFSAARLSWI